MHFNSVEQILTQLEQQPGWEKFKEYRQLLKCWNSTVNTTTAEHTRPLYVARQVLWVAASSASRAQELSFQRYTLLKRLNKQLPFTLKDIRFSSSQWHQTQQPDRPVIFNASKQQKFKVNSSISNITPQESRERYASPSTTAKDAARRCLETLKQSSSSLFSCPNCHSYTPKEEIERWTLCHHCVAAKWSEKYRPSIQETK